MTAEQRRALAAALARVLPGDPAAGEPGAAELGAADYAAAALAGRERGWWPLCEQGLAVLDGLAEEAGGVAFADAPEAVQDAALAELAAMTAGAPRAFFSRLVQLALEGCLADPGYGGNRGGRGWSALGATPPGSCCGPGPELGPAGDDSVGPAAPLPPEDAQSRPASTPGSAPVPPASRLLRERRRSAEDASAGTAPSPLEASRKTPCRGGACLRPGGGEDRS